MVIATEATFEANVNFGDTGLVGTIGVQIIDQIGGTTLPRTTAGIAEAPANSGLYYVTLPTPADDGQYQIIWDDGLGTYANDDLVVQLGGSPIPDVDLPPAMPDDGAGPQLGPCTAWTTAEEVALCLDLTVDSVNLDFLDRVAVEASMLLFEKSGRQFTGVCEAPLARPCRDNCTWCGQILSRGHIVNWDGRGWSWDDCGVYCGCRPSSRVLLPGYPVREVISVSIGAETLDPAAYQLDRWQWLTRIDGSRWPACQDLNAAVGEAGSFVVRYTTGTNPPPLGQRAAAELAAQLALACPTEIGDIDGECVLPVGTTSVTRLGVSIQVQGFVSWAYQDKRWQTGLPLTDAFLNTYNPHGLRRRAMSYSPDGPEFAAILG